MLSFGSVHHEHRARIEVSTLIGSTVGAYRRTLWVEEFGLGDFSERPLSTGVPLSLCEPNSRAAITNTPRAESGL